MVTSLNREELTSYVLYQLNNFFPDCNKVDKMILKKSIDMGLERTEYCFKFFKNEQYNDGVNTYFSHLHADQYATFLYFIANSMWKTYAEKNTCDKLLNLQRTLHSFFLSYKCPMPNVFCLCHPIGSIIGNAIYSDGLCIGQNVTINTSKDSRGNLDLRIGKGVWFAPGAKIIGNKKIGDRVSIGIDVTIYNEEIENDLVVIIENGKKVIRKRINDLCVAERMIKLNEL